MFEVMAEIEIAADPTDIAAVMFDPHRDAEWVAAVRSVEVLDPGIKPGARVRRAGTVHGWDVSWTTEVAAFHFPHLLELRIAEGPIAGSIVYQVVRSAGGSVARIRGQVEVDGLGVPASLIAGPVRAALTDDLKRLKALVEHGTRAAASGQA